MAKLTKKLDVKLSNICWNRKQIFSNDAAAADGHYVGVGFTKNAFPLNKDHVSFVHILK